MQHRLETLAIKLTFGSFLFCLTSFFTLKLLHKNVQMQFLCVCKVLMLNPLHLLFVSGNN